MKNKKHSSQTKTLMSKAKLGIKHYKFTGYIITPFGEFESCKLAAEAEGRTSTCISIRIHNKNFPEYYRKALEL